MPLFPSPFLPCAMMHHDDLRSSASFFLFRALTFFGRLTFSLAPRESRQKAHDHFETRFLHRIHCHKRPLLATYSIYRLYTALERSLEYT